MAGRIAYMSDDTYKDPTHNPPRADGTYSLPTRQLRQMFRNSAAKPVAALQELVRRGAVDANAFALGLGTTDAEAKATLEDRGGPLSLVWSNDRLTANME